MRKVDHKYGKYINTESLKLLIRAMHVAEEISEIQAHIQKEVHHIDNVKQRFHKGREQLCPLIQEVMQPTSRSLQSNR